MKFFRAWCTQLNFCCLSLLFISRSALFSILGSQTQFGYDVHRQEHHIQKTGNCARLRIVPYVCTYINIFQEVRQLCMNYRQHKYLLDWTISKKDTHVQSQENLGGELCTLSLSLLLEPLTWQWRMYVMHEHCLIIK